MYYVIFVTKNPVSFKTDVLIKRKDKIFPCLKNMVFVEFKNNKIYYYDARFVFNKYPTKNQIEHSKKIWDDICGNMVAYSAFQQKTHYCWEKYKN